MKLAELVWTESVGVDDVGGLAVAAAEEQHTEHSYSRLRNKERYNIFKSLILATFINNLNLALKSVPPPKMSRARRRHWRQATSKLLLT